MTSSVQGRAQVRPLSLLMRLVGRFDQVSYFIIVAAMAAMTALVSAQVFYRYVLSSSIDSADELSRLFFIWAMFMAIPPGIKHGVHIGIDILVRALSPSVQEKLFRLMCAASAVLMLLVFYVTIYVTADKWQDMMPTVNITAAVYYIPVLISAGHSVLHLLIFALGGSKVWQEAQS